MENVILVFGPTHDLLISSRTEEKQAEGLFDPRSNVVGIVLAIASRFADEKWERR